MCLLQTLGEKITKAAANLKTCLIEAYGLHKLVVPGEIIARSIQSSSINAAFTNLASVEEVCYAATWSSILTFGRHYEINKTQRMLLSATYCGYQDDPPML